MVDLTCEGMISHGHVSMFEGLLVEPSLDLEVMCHITNAGLSASKTSSFMARIMPCQLSLVVYGPYHLFEEIGSFFQDYDVYLQDPLNCRRDVKYCNPHRLSSEELSSCPMTSTLSSMLQTTIELEELPAQAESLDLLDSQQNFPEAPQPTMIKSKL